MDRIDLDGILAVKRSGGEDEGDYHENLAHEMEPACFQFNSLSENPETNGEIISVYVRLDLCETDHGAKSCLSAVLGLAALPETGCF
jgi:hypothetical protein